MTTDLSAWKLRAQHLSLLCICSLIFSSIFPSAFCIFPHTFSHAPLPIPPAKGHCSQVLLEAQKLLPQLQIKTCLDAAVSAWKTDDTGSTQLLDPPFDCLQKQISGSGAATLLRFWFQFYNINDSLLNNLKFWQGVKTFLHSVSETVDSSASKL